MGIVLVNMTLLKIAPFPIEPLLILWYDWGEVVLMKNDVRNNFTGYLSLFSDDWDCVFALNSYTVTVTPFTDNAVNALTKRTFESKSEIESHFIYGVSDKGKQVAFLCKTGFNFTYSDSGVISANFPVAMIIQGAKRDNLNKFKRITFYGGIVNFLKHPESCIQHDFEENTNWINDIKFKRSDEFTTNYDLTLNKIKCRLVCSCLKAADENRIGQGAILCRLHSTFCFDFDKEQPIEDIDKYYTYAQQLFQFCSGRENVGFTIELSVPSNFKGESCTMSAQVRHRDGFRDYANDMLHLQTKIVFNSLGDKLPRLIELFSNKETTPLLKFFPTENRNSNVVFNRQYLDLCIAVEREFYLNNKVNTPKKNCLKDKEPTARQKIRRLYKYFEDDIEQISSSPLSSKKMNDGISKFLKTRDSSAHSIGNIEDDTDIFFRLRLTVYLSVLQRAGYTNEERVKILNGFGYFDRW